MLMGQIVIGGITRLTGSGLSITKWEIVTGTLPPSNEAAWEAEFDLYKETPQYSKINDGMSMKEFKFKRYGMVQEKKENWLKMAYIIIK